MDSLWAARAQMAVSLGFHIVFAAFGIGMPLLMVLAEWMGIRTRRAYWRELARTWTRVTAILFAVGAVSGTALSFELGLLWPHFMRIAGPIIGPAFALEGFAFFIEAIFIGLYLYGWDRLSERTHLLTGVPVAVSGMISGVLVVAANAWMQVPRGFELRDGTPVELDALATFRNPAWIPMALHSTLSCYIAVGFLVAGVYAFAMLRGRAGAGHHAALKLALSMGAIAALLQPLSGDICARAVARHQPVKLAAMEALAHGMHGAPLTLGGIANQSGEVRLGVELPKALSLLTEHDANGFVAGLDSVPLQERPNVLVTHLAFDAMIGCGMLLVLVGATYWLTQWRRSDSPPRWLLRALLVSSPLGLAALEAGWVVTEVGRQPWTLFRMMTTREAVTPAAGVPVTFVGFVLLYLGLGVALVALLRSLAARKTAAQATKQPSRSDHA